MSAGNAEAVGQMEYITGYSVARQATIARNWTFIPTGTVKYRILSAPGGSMDVNVTSINGNPGNATALVTAIGLIDAPISGVTAPTATAIRQEMDANSQKLADIHSGAFMNADGLNMVQAMRMLLAVNCGAMTGAATQSPVFRAVDNSKNRLSATTSGGSRSNVNIDPN